MDTGVVDDIQRTIVGPDISKEEMRRLKGAMEMVAKSMFILWNKIPRGWSVSDVRYEDSIVSNGVTYDDICHFVVDIRKD